MPTSFLSVLALATWLAWLLTLPPRPSAWLIAVSGLPLLAGASWLAFRGRPGRWRDFARSTADYHVIGVVLLAALGVQFADAHGVTTDGVIYFSQLRSVLFEGNLDVAAEFAYLRQPPRPSHVVPVGPTFVWLPLYGAVAVIDSLGRAIGLWASASEPGIGLTQPYVRAALVSSFAIGAVGLFVVHRRLREEFRPAVACGTTLLLFLATPLVWYMVYEPSMTHAASFGFVAVFVVAAERYTGLTMKAGHGALLGSLLGLAFITRPQEALFALFPAILLAGAKAPISVRLRAALRLGGWAFVGVAPFLFIQALHSAILMRRENFALVGSGGYLNVADSRWADTLWSSWHGFFSWTPVAYLAFLALFAYAARRRAWAVAAIVIVLGMAWVNGSTADWAAGWSFGGRRFISVLVVLAPGLALILHALIRRPLVSLSIIALALIGWNHVLAVQHSRGLVRPGAPVSFADLVRQQATLATASPFNYPFAFPANAWFAWRTGLDAEHYDLLGSERLQSHIDIEMTADTARYLTTGWGARSSDPFGELRWIDGAGAELLVPLALAPDTATRVAWTVRTRRLDPPEDATFVLVVNGTETFRFTPETEQASFFAFTVPAKSGLLRRGFNRLALERRGGTAPLAVYRVALHPAEEP